MPREYARHITCMSPPPPTRCLFLLLRPAFVGRLPSTVAVQVPPPPSSLKTLQTLHDAHVPCCNTTWLPPAAMLAATGTKQLGHGGGGMEGAYSVVVVVGGSHIVGP